MMYRALFLTIFILGLCIIVSNPSRAQVPCTACLPDVVNQELGDWGGTVDDIEDKVDDEEEKHEEWLGETFFADHILDSMKKMASQLSAVATQQVMVFGTFLDSKHQLETQRLFQKMTAQSHKDYHPSEGLCEIGSSVKSLAASERKGEFTSLLLSQRSIDRQLGNAYSSAAGGKFSDLKSRITQFSEKFCDPRDNNGALAVMCKHKNGVGAQDPLRINKDIDYTRTVDAPWTLGVDFTDTELKDEEEELLALSNNLYGHEVFPRLGADQLTFDTKRGVNPTLRSYLEARSIVAKRNVAENSFNAITAMKTEGTPAAKEFLKAVVAELGVQDDDELSRLMGENPSYYAQMEVLTKKLYQTPDFYTNLYDKPANVNRKAVAMQALGLMQKFDAFKSQLRAEASLSVLLELAVIDLQDEYENEIAKPRSE